MPSNTGGNSGGWWDTYGDDIWGAAMMMYLQNQQNNRDNRAPQMTPVPLTPEQQWRFDRGKELFNYSPTRDYVGSYSHQFLQGLNGPNGIGAIGQNHQWLSPNMQGQQLAGGFRMPQVDMSNLPQPWTYNRPDGTGQQRPGQPGGAGQGPGAPAGPRPGGGGGSINGGGNGPVGNGRLNDDGGTGDPSGLLTPRMPEQWGGRNVVTPGNYPGVTNPNTPNPYINRNPPTGGGGQGAAQPPAGGGEPAEGGRGVFGRIADAFRNFQSSTPQWMDMGITAIITAVAASAGLPPQLVAPIVRAIMGGNSRPNMGGNAGDGSGFIPGSISGQGGQP
jgi:hypothetical protein